MRFKNYKGKVVGMIPSLLIISIPLFGSYPTKSGCTTSLFFIFLKFILQDECLLIKKSYHNLCSHSIIQKYHIYETPKLLSKSI